MASISFFRRREIWLPTIWGWLTLLGITGAAAVATALHVYAFLAPSEPLPAARVLIVEGWLSHGELDQAVRAIHARGYERVITTGGPVEGAVALLDNRTYAEIAADYLKRQGVGDAELNAVPAPPAAQHRTYRSAVRVRDWAAEHGITLDAFDVFSAGVHARRSRMLYRIAFGADAEVGVLAARPHAYDIHRWWGASVGAKAVLGEVIGLSWTVCCFRPDSVHSLERLSQTPQPKAPVLRGKPPA